MVPFLLVLFSLGSGGVFAQDRASLALVPIPSKIELDAGGKYKLPKKVVIDCPDRLHWKSHLRFAFERIGRLIPDELEQQFAKDQPTVTVRHDAKLTNEAYRLEINERQITIATGTLKGLARATATLLQVVGAAKVPGQLPCGLIEDAPQSIYRNFMIDMGRNPHSLALLKETIDLLWYYKIDSVQLHLTDDQRFAFPSTAFPKLWDGLITADQFRELEAYAVMRGVTIIPELEVPGHSSKLTGIYPETFGKNSTELASNPKAIAGIKTLLDEMMAVFSSSPYVHIGGDEAFGVPEELQRDLINQLHGYLKEKGKQTIVWEGPRAGEGNNKVHPDVIHINWRTINYRADKMLKDGYRVVNATWDPLYLVDHYPRINFTMTSPQHIYENLKLTRFKHVNPGIQTFAAPIDVAASDQLIGFCMPWWEGREENFVPQCFPRLIPFAEIAWGHPEDRNHADFARRVVLTESTRQRAFYPIVIRAENLAVPKDGVFHETTTVSIECVNANLRRGADSERSTAGVIRYTLDGSEPGPDSKTYDAPVSIRKSCTVRARWFENGKPQGHGVRKNFVAVKPVQHLALGKPVTSSVSSGPPFSVQRLTDGGTENLDFYLGYPATDDSPIELTVDLEQPQLVSKISVVSYSISGSYEKYRVQVSGDGRQFTTIGSQLEKPEKVVGEVPFEIEPQKIRYVRVLSYGNRGYVFDSFSKVIEIRVE